MSENLSTELQALSSPKTKLWQIASYMLMIAGLFLLGAGGWMFYQYRLEASKPPPAPILEASVSGEEETPLPRPTSSPTPMKQTTVSTQPVADIGTVQPVESPAVSPAPTQRVFLEESLSREKTNTPAVQATPTRETEAIEPGPEIEPATEVPLTLTPLSLAQNPLLVKEEIVTPPAQPETDLAQTTASTPTLPSRVVAESISLDAPVVKVGWKQVLQNGVSTNVWEVASYAVGWHKNSMLPGQGGNIVLSGHHNIKGEVFRYIVDLEPGALISLYVGEQRYDYFVVEKFIVKDRDEPEEIRRENAKWVGPFNEERLTLVTCWPYTNNTHRVIVIAKPNP